MPSSSTTSRFFYELQSRNKNEDGKWTPWETVKLARGGRATNLTEARVDDLAKRLTRLMQPDLQLRVLHIQQFVTTFPVKKKTGVWGL